MTEDDSRTSDPVLPYASRISSSQGRPPKPLAGSLVAVCGMVNTLIGLLLTVVSLLLCVVAFQPGTDKEVPTLIGLLVVFGIGGLWVGIAMCRSVHRVYNGSPDPASSQR